MQIIKIDELNIDGNCSFFLFGNVTTELHPLGACKIFLILLLTFILLMINVDLFKVRFFGACCSLIM